METSGDVLANAHQLVARSGVASGGDRPPVYKAIGISLAVASGVFIGTSFVLKKMGLLKANAKYNEEAGEGYGYLKNAWWWTGMTLMIVGEICNFAAYAFVDAILVTPLGALSVVLTTILSAIFLKERLSFVGKVGCFNCIIGSVVIVMNAPSESAVADIEGMKDFVVTPGFLTYTGVIVVACAFIALWVGPRYGKKSMLVYISVCSLIGGLSVVCTQGLGAAIVAQAGGKPQFNQWFIYVLLVFVIATLLTEIIYLNKALNLFNAALVTPTYYVFFTSATIVTSAILFQGFKGTPMSIATVIMGFLQICAGVVLLQMSKSAKDVPDAAVFKGDLDQVREIGEQKEPETEPKADAIRGAAALLRRISMSRQKMEEAEARQFHEEKAKDQLEPVSENEIVEWDGLRRRKTIVGDGLRSPIQRQKTIHPPLGMSHFPNENEHQQSQVAEDGRQQGFFETVRTRASSVLRHHQPRHVASEPVGIDGKTQTRPVALADIKVYPAKMDTPIEPYGPGSMEEAQQHIYGLPQGLRKSGPWDINPQNSPRSKPLPAQPAVQSPAGAPNIPLPSPLGNSNRRQFSFQNMFRGAKSPAPGDHQSNTNLNPPSSRSGIGSRSGSAEQKRAMKTATEEERLGLVHGDSQAALLDPELHSHSEPNSDPDTSPPRLPSHELHYPYAATAEDSVASSPEAQTPLVPKHTYLLSSSTMMSDHAPLYKEPHTPSYFDSGHGSGYPAPPPPLEEEAGVDYDQWQIPSNQPRTPRSPPTTAASPPSPLPPSHDHQSHLPAYQSINPHQPREQPQRPQHSHKLPQSRGLAAAIDSNSFQMTPTSRRQNTADHITARDTIDYTRSDSPNVDARTQAPVQEQAQSTTATDQLQLRRQRSDQDDLEQALEDIRVTSMQEREYEERWRRFAQQKQQRDAKIQSRAEASERDRGGGGDGGGGGNGGRADRGAGGAAGAFV